MSKWANIDVLKARIDEDVREDKVLDGWAFFFKAYLDSAPTIELKCGEWIHHKSFDMGHKNYEPCRECSCCHIWYQYDNIPKLNYCPNCGCLMKGKYNV